MVSLKYTITKEDYISFYTHVMWDAGDRKRSRAKNILKQLGFVLLFLAVYYFAGGFRFLSKISAGIILLMFATSLLPLIGGRAGTERQAEDFAEDPENASVFTDHILEVSEEGLEVKTGASDLKYSWKAITRRTETSAYYFLFLNAIHALIIPKRAIGSNEEALEFKKLLTRHLSLDADIKDDIIHEGQ